VSVAVALLLKYILISLVCSETEIIVNISKQFKLNLLEFMLVCVYILQCVDAKFLSFLQMLSMTLLRVDGRIHRKEVQTRCMIAYSVRNGLSGCRGLHC
jgi:hypothetical protein